MKNMKSILNVSFKALFIAVLCFVATEVAEAKTITSTNTFFDQSSFNYFSDVYDREDYKYSIMTSESIQNSSFNYLTYYYVCLSNDEPNVTNTTNVKASCDKLIRYYRNNNSFNVDLLSDDELSIQNGVYYYFSNKYYFLECILFIIAVLICLCFLYFVIIDIFGGHNV